MIQGASSRGRGLLRALIAIGALMLAASVAARWLPGSLGSAHAASAVRGDGA